MSVHRAVVVVLWRERLLDGGGWIRTAGCEWLGNGVELGKWGAG
jgi:hypothetical protein